MCKSCLSRRSLLARGVTLVGALAMGGSGLITTVAPRPVAHRTTLPRPEPLKITDCDSWGAREPSGELTVLDRRPEKVIVHHTATRNRDDVSQTDLNVLARAIQNYHMDARGWIDSGQHFLVNRGGLIAEGRHRSLESLLVGRRLVEGAHCTDQNDSSIGIENEGIYLDEDQPEEQYEALRALCAVTCQQYAIDPAELYGHRDYADTACPGDELYETLPKLREDVAAMLGAKLTWRSPPTWPLLRPADRGPKVLAAQHLLRAAGLTGVPADGTFGPATSNGVYEFQRRHGMELTGVIGGGSWPLLAVPVRPGEGGEAALAVAALTARGQRHVPETMSPAAWQRLLGTGGQRPR